MELTPRETKFIERLKRQQRQWPRARWFVLGVGVLVFVIYISLLIWDLKMFLPHIETEGSPAHVAHVALLFLVFNWTTFLIAMGFSFWCLVTVIRDWNGNMNRALLLKLLEAQQKQANNSPAKP